MIFVQAHPTKINIMRAFSNPCANLAPTLRRACAELARAGFLSNYLYFVFVDSKFLDKDFRTTLIWAYPFVRLSACLSICLLDYLSLSLTLSAGLSRIIYFSLSLSLLFYLSFYIYLAIDIYLYPYISILFIFLYISLYIFDYYLSFSISIYRILNI